MLLFLTGEGLVIGFPNEWMMNAEERAGLQQSRLNYHLVQEYQQYQQQRIESYGVLKAPELVRPITETAALSVGAATTAVNAEIGGSFLLPVGAEMFALKGLGTAIGIGVRETGMAAAVGKTTVQIQKLRLVSTLATELETGAMIARADANFMSSPRTLALMRAPPNPVPLSAANIARADEVLLLPYRAGNPRYLPGVASHAGGLPQIQAGQRWLRGSHGNVGKIPDHIARQLSGQRFDTFDDFREAFWRAVGGDSNLASQFSTANQRLMRQGFAPVSHSSQQVGKRIKYELDHLQEIQHGGNVYDMNNIIIRTPLNHIYGK